MSKFKRCAKCFDEYFHTEEHTCGLNTESCKVYFSAKGSRFEFIQLPTDYRKISPTMYKCLMSQVDEIKNLEKANDRKWQIIEDLTAKLEKVHGILEHRGPLFVEQAIKELEGKS